MKQFLLFSVILLLSGCTSLNDKCGYLPPGDCWQDTGHCDCNIPVSHY